LRSGKHGVVFLRFKGPHFAGFIRFDLNGRELRGGVGEDDSGVIAEFEKEFDPPLVVALGEG